MYDHFKHIRNFPICDSDNIKNFLENNKILYSEHQLLNGGLSTYTFFANLFEVDIFKSFTDSLISITKRRPIDMWSNIGFPGTSVKPHNHYSENFPNSISGVYYLYKPKNSGNLIVEGNEISVKTGDLVLFDDTKMHWTNKNESIENRIVISFNLY